MSKKHLSDSKLFWLKLDNAAKIFPGQNSRTWSNSFRVCYELKEKIDPQILYRALCDVLPRFPCYDVRIRKGFFWYYLEKNVKAPILLEDIKNPCLRVKFRENNNFLFKIYYFSNRISIDFYHVLTDGHGAAVFLSTLVAQYLRLSGAEIPCGGFVLDINSSATKEELEDSFVKNANSKAKYSRRDKFVYHSKGTRLPEHNVNIISGIMSFSQLHNLTSQYGVTVTEFFAAVMLDVIIKKQRNENCKQKEVSIQIPADLRRTFLSDTLRNFTVCLRVKIDPNKGDYTFEELLTQVKYQLRLVNNKKDLNALITANMGIEKNPVVRRMPLWVKNLGVAVSFFFTAEQTTSSLLTNLGKIDIPPEMSAYVNKFIFMPAPGKLNAARFGVATCNDNVVVTFANCYYESDIEREFFTFLVKKGIHIKIESNRE